MKNWTLDDLKKWDDRIKEIADNFGLSYYPQEFEICDYHDMLGYEAYLGLPSHYNHWSYGKAFEKQRTLYQHGMVGLPYELVINSNPCLAYLMVDNSLALQILTMAHVYAHNDFFKNNENFKHTRPEFTVEMFKLHANRVKKYIEDPGIGFDKVERILDAAHSIAFQCNRYKRIKYQTNKEVKQKIIDNLRREPGEWDHLTNQEEEPVPDFTKVPLEPEYDVLYFIRDHHPSLEDWEKDLMTIVREETDYIMPQIETKITNEGWATFWHYHILKKLDLPEDLHWAFIKAHNQIVRPHLYSINPYHVGYEMFKAICRDKNDYDEDSEVEPCDELSSIREIDSDRSFLQRYLTEKLMRKLNLLEFEETDRDYKVSEIADKDGWKEIKKTLIKNTGFNSIPVVKVKLISFANNYELILEHDSDGRELHLEYLENTLKYIHQLWGRTVTVKTKLDGDDHLCYYNAEGFKTQSM